jgi:hypothetical protein
MDIRVPQLRVDVWNGAYRRLEGVIMKDIYAEGQVVISQ